MCNGFGTDSITVLALLGVCAVVLVPVWLPVYGAYVAVETVGKHVKDAKKQRRTTNVVKKVKNRYIKRLGAGEWQGYLQKTFDRAQEEPTAAHLHELGVAMLLADDVSKSVQYLTSALDCWDTDSTRAASIRFARGIANQTLRDHRSAARDFSEAAALHEIHHPTEDLQKKKKKEKKCDARAAPPTPNLGLPQLTRAECLNSLGYSLYLTALYDVMRSGDFTATMDTHNVIREVLPGPAAAQVADLIRSDSVADRVCEARQLLNQAICKYDEAISLTKVEPRGMFFYNRGHAKYHLALLHAVTDAVPPPRYTGAWSLPAKDNKLINEALADFDRAVALPNFGTAAEGHAMRSQALAVLGQVESARIAAETADSLDPKVFLVDLASAAQLLAPWPLPPPPAGSGAHEFQATRLVGPHHCDHCLSFIANPAGASSCKCCQFTVHRACETKARKLHTCWRGKVIQDTARSLGEIDTQKDQNEVPEAAPGPHVHRMMYTRFHVPTTCCDCGELAVRTYQCVECNHLVDPVCLDRLKNCIILDDASECTTC